MENIKGILFYWKGGTRTIRKVNASPQNMQREGRPVASEILGNSGSRTWERKPGPTSNDPGTKKRKVWVQRTNFLRKYVADWGLVSIKVASDW